MFQVERGSFGKFNKIVLLNDHSKESVTIIPDFGGAVNELRLRKGDQNHSIIDGYETAEEMESNDWSKSIKLIPFPNRIQDGKYNFNNKDYQLDINFPKQNHAIHGFIKDKKLQVIREESDSERAMITLVYKHDGSTEGYPFKFFVEIDYILSKDGFECKTTIENKEENQDIPVGDGWHPYFTTGSDVSDLELTLPVVDKIEVDDRQIPNGKKTLFNEFKVSKKIGGTILDTCFTVEQSSKAITKIKDPKKDLTINVWQETGNRSYNFVQVFTPPKKTVIAIEPMTCNMDAFNNKEGLIVLRPNEYFTASYGVTLV